MEQNGMPIVSDTVGSPRYVQVYSALREWIKQGVYAPGSRLPSEQELCELFGVSRITVRSAVEMLEKQSMVERKQGRGTFVSEATGDVPSQGDFSELVRRLRQLDAKSTLSRLEITHRPADEAVAWDLQIGVGEPVVHASYTRARDNEPIGITDLYIPGSLGVELTADDLKKSPAPTILQGKGFEILGAHQLIGATLADSRIAQQLHTTVGAPIVRVRLLVLDFNSRPIELLTAHYLADRYVHHVFLSARPGTMLS
jgi:GntR family transcriptional regulator